jgi:hypothetical protein
MRLGLLKGLAGWAQSLLSGVIILMLTSIYLLGSFGLLATFVLLDILRIRRLGPH